MHTRLNQAPIIVSSDGVYKAASNWALFHTHFLTFEWARDAAGRKKKNQFHESLHAQLCLCNLSISFNFPLPLKTKLTEARRFDQLIPTISSKNTEVLWRGEKNLIHALKTRGSVLTHKHKRWAHLFKLVSTLNFPLNSAEGPVPEWVEPVVSICHNRWTFGLLSACPAKRMTLHILFQPFFCFGIIHHLWAPSLLRAALPLRHKWTKTVYDSMDSYFSLGTSNFAFLTAVNSNRHEAKETEAEQQ